VIEFRGLGVYPGEYIGRVKLVFKLEDLEKIERGDVIVAPMTNP
jgi:phosphoenolpyruvate synthase/pyruvate phosphate dikinase